MLLLSLFLILPPHCRWEKVPSAFNIEESISASSRGKKEFRPFICGMTYNIVFSLSFLIHTTSMSLLLWSKYTNTSNELLLLMNCCHSDVFVSPGDELSAMSVVLGERQQMCAAGRLVCRQKSATENRVKHFYVFQKCLIYPLAKLRWHKVTLI